MNAMVRESETRSLIEEEIADIVRQAADRGELIRVGEHAKRLHDLYGPSGYSVGRIIDELILAATNEKIAVEIDRGV